MVSSRFVIKLARDDTLALLSVKCERVGAPFSSCVLLVNSWASRKFDQHWANIGSHAVASSFKAKVDRQRSSEPFILSKANLCLVGAVLTGPCLINVHAERLSILPDVSCSICLEEDKLQAFDTSFLIVPPLQS